MPPPLVMPKKRDLEQELEELERALAGRLRSSEDVQSLPNRRFK